MEISEAAIIVSIATGISGAILGWLGRSRSIRQEDRQQVSASAVMRSDMDYIKRGIDDIRLEQRSQVTRIDALTERVARTEESLKSEHLRLNRIDAILERKE